MKIIARIIFVLFVWVVVYHVADNHRQPVPSWYEPTE